MRELHAKGQLVKRFKVPARNQELILAAFQEQGWPSHIDDPLPPQHVQVSKQRLHDAIDRLNRNRVNRLIRFRGNGNGLGILWELIADRSPTLVLLHSRVKYCDGDTKKSAFYFLYKTNDPKKHGNNVQLFFGNGEAGTFSVSGSLELLVDLGKVDFEEDADPKKISVTHAGFGPLVKNAEEGHVYLFIWNEFGTTWATISTSCSK